MLGPFPLPFGLPAELRLPLLSGISAVLRQRRPPSLPGADDDPTKQSDGNTSCGGKRASMALREFLQAIDIARRPGEHWFAIQITLNIRRKSSGGVITAGPVLLEALHCNPVEIPLHQVDKPGGLDPALLG